MDAAGRGWNPAWRAFLWRQYGAAIDMLEGAVRACPDDLWGDRGRQPEFWYLVYHTLFWLDLYVGGTREGFAPPPPFTLGELDPAGVLPDRVYAKDELLAYLAHGREKCRAILAGLTAGRAGARCDLGWRQWDYLELLLYNLRHVQHHTGQLDLILRQVTDSTPGWVAVAQTALDDPA